MTIPERPADTSQYRKLDRSVLLLSELEILVSQTRVIEIYIKQAKANAEMETARLHEQFESQLAALTAEIRENENELVDLRTKLVEGDGSAQKQLLALQAQLREEQGVLDLRNEEIQKTESEIASLRAQILNLEFSQNEKEATARKAQQTRDRLETDLARLRSELEETSLKLQEERAAAREREENLRRELHELNTRWSDQEERSDARESQLRDSDEKIASLSRRIEELERDRTDALARAARESEQIRAAFEARVTEFQVSLEQKDQSLKESQATLSESEGRLQAEIQNLQNQLADTQQRLESRDGELSELRAHAAGLQERVQQFETSNQQSLTVLETAERVRRELENEIAGLRAEVGAKEQALAERQAAVAELEESLRTRTDEWQRQQEPARADFDVQELDLQNLRSETASLRVRLSELETASEASGQTTLRETGELRQKFAAELAQVRATLVEKETRLTAQEQSFSTIQTRLTEELTDLRNRLAAKDADLDNRTSELQQAHANLVALVEQKEKLQMLQTQTERLLSAQADQIRQQVRAELAAVENALRDKDERLEAAQRRIVQSEERLNTKVSDLQFQLAEKQLLLESRCSENEGLKGQILRLSEQVSELESDNRRVEAAGAGTADRLRNELANLREQFRQTELRLEEQKAQTIELRELQEQLSVTRRSADDREHVLEAVRAEVAALQERLDQLALSNQQEKAAAEQSRTLREVESETLRSELQQKDWALAQRQAALENLAQAHKAQIQQLEAKALEQQQLAQSCSHDVEKAQSEAADLRERNTQLEAAVEHAQASGGEKTAQLERQYQSRMAALQAELEQRTLELNERTQLAEQSGNALGAEIQRLHKEAQEKHALLENRNEEVLLAKSEMDSLRQRLTEVEAEARRNQEVGASEAEKMRTEFQAQLALLQAELSQKEWDLDERQGGVNGLAQDLSAQVQDLQTRLAEKEALLEARPDGHVVNRLEATDLESERLQRMEELVAAAINAEHSFPASRKRRWRTRVGWKNRWRS